MNNHIYISLSSFQCEQILLKQSSDSIINTKSTCDVSIQTVYVYINYFSLQLVFQRSHVLKVTEEISFTWSVTCKQSITGTNQFCLSMIQVRKMQGTHLKGYLSCEPFNYCKTVIEARIYCKTAIEARKY